MSAVGAEKTQEANTKTFVAALITGLVVGAVYIGLFYVLHGRNQKVFQPKSYLGPPQSVMLHFDWHSRMLTIL